MLSETIRLDESDLEDVLDNSPIVTPSAVAEPVAAAPAPVAAVAEPVAAAPAPVAAVAEPVAVEPAEASPIAVTDEPAEASPIAVTDEPAAVEPTAQRAGKLKARPTAGRPSPTGKKKIASPTGKKKIVSPTSKKKMTTPQSSAKASSTNLPTGDTPAQKPKCLWASILLIITLLFTIFAMTVQYLSITDKTVAAGLRGPIKNIATLTEAIPLGPEVSAAAKTAVKASVDAAKTSNDAGKAATTELQTML